MSYFEKRTPGFELISIKKYITIESPYHPHSLTYEMKS